jgi:hypothetical protein
MAMLGVKFFTAVKHLTIPLYAMHDLGPGGVLAVVKAIMVSAIHPIETYQTVTEKDPWVRDNNYDRNLKQIAMRLEEPGSSEVKAFYEHAAMWMMDAVVGWTRQVSWFAAYPIGLEKFNGDESLAREYAHVIASRAGGSFSAKDTSAFMRGSSAWKRIFGMFYTFSGTRINFQWEEFQRFGHDPDINKYRFWADRWRAFAIIYLALAAGETILDKSTRPKRVGEKPTTVGDWAESFVKHLMVGSVFGIPIVKDMTAAIVHGRKYEISPLGRAFGAPVDLVQSLLSTDKKVKTEARVSLAIDTLGYMTGAPSSAAVTFWKGIEDIKQGKVRGTADQARALIRRPEAKKKGKHSWFD